MILGNSMFQMNIDLYALMLGDAPSFMARLQVYRPTIFNFCAGGMSFERRGNYL